MPCFGSIERRRRFLAGLLPGRKRSSRISVPATPPAATQILAEDSRPSACDREGVRTVGVMGIDTDDRPFDQVVAGLERSDLYRKPDAVVAHLRRSHGQVLAVGTHDFQLGEQ